MTEDKEDDSKIKVEKKMVTTPNLATYLNYFDSDLGSVENSKTPSPKCVHFNTKVDVNLFDAESAFDGKKHKRNKSNKRRRIESKYVYDRKEFEGIEKKNIIFNNYRNDTLIKTCI